MVEIQGIEFPTSDGSSLRFDLLSVSNLEIVFLVNLRTPWLSAHSEATTYVSGPPSTLFSEIAVNWSGWEGEKSWSDLEERVSFVASSDSTGHVTLLTRIIGPNYEDQVEARLTYEAGSLESMAKRISALFEGAT